MNKKHIIIFTLALTLFLLIIYVTASPNAKVDIKQPINITTLDTMIVSYTYWWSNSGPFIGYCGDEYSLVFLGTVSEISPPIKDTTLMYTAQKGIIKIEDVLKVRTLSKQKYDAEKYLVSDCFYDSEIKEGDKVIVFCYEYEGYYNIPSHRSIMKINGFDDPMVGSIKTYIESNQNPIKIKKDIELWEKKGFGSELKQIIACAEHSITKNKE